ncbi:MAG TPA: polyphosphate:AMP phosphotransferase [Thermoanaerobaculia bacterium]|nr:polyphosphate:AMP phosphotransferase [Thermoanaerobaculia bacterium]
MFEAAELGRKTPKAEFEEALPALRTRLLEAQRRLRESGRAAIVIIGGADGAGKGDTLNKLQEWLDPRGLETNVFAAPTDEERDRPHFWRFWRALPPAGKIGIFYGSWYTDPIVRRAYKKIDDGELDQMLARIAFTEEMLARDGAIIVKLWFHLSKKAQKKRLEKFESSPSTKWRVSPVDWKHFEMYDRFVKVSERALRKTDAADAPWVVIESSDDRFRDLTAGMTLAETLERRLAEPKAKAAVKESAPSAVPNPVTILDNVDLKAKIADDEYDKKLVRLQGRLNKATWKASTEKVSTVAVFDGWDAAGKGGAIRRVSQAIDARLLRVVSIAAPTDEERKHHYLWRFWRHISRAGVVTIFDRSWYGRVLVERVEGFASEEEWKRAFLEINDFEEQLAERGIALAKFWLHVSPEEQLRRFKERGEVDWKKHKLTEEDWRNREKWNAYEGAVNEMVARTSTRIAPWTIIPANDKKLARIEVLRTLADTIEAAV